MVNNYVQISFNYIEVRGNKRKKIERKKDCHNVAINCTYLLISSKHYRRSPSTKSNYIAIMNIQKSTADIGMVDLRLNSRK